MRRLLVTLACVVAAVPAAPASASPAECVATPSLPACAGTCRAGETISVTAYGQNVAAHASCGGTTVSCFTVRPSCSNSGTAASSGPLTCTVTGNAVAICDVKVAST